MLTNVNKVNMLLPLALSQTMKRTPNKSTLDIKLQMVRLRMSTSALAKNLDRPRQTISTAIHHPTRFPRVWTQILDALFL